MDEWIFVFNDSCGEKSNKYVNISGELSAAKRIIEDRYGKSWKAIYIKEQFVPEKNQTEYHDCFYCKHVIKQYDKDERICTLDLSIYMDLYNEPTPINCPLRLREERLKKND